MQSEQMCDSVSSDESFAREEDSAYPSPFANANQKRRVMLSDREKAVLLAATTFIFVILMVITGVDVAMASKNKNNNVSTENEGEGISTHEGSFDIPVLDKRLMEISRVSAKLAALAYEEQSVEVLDAALPSTDLTGSKPTNTPIALANYINFYTNEPDQAIVARYGGRCYISFRGTKLNPADWGQNIDLGDRLIYRNGDTLQPACESRRGFGDFLQTPEVVAGRNDVLSCVESCVAAGSDPEDCLVITGHSQGGATATIASILLYDQLPTVVTFGQPPAVDPECDWIPSERFYRFVNSKVESGEDDDLAFDAVPFSPTFISGSAHYGYYLMLGDNDAGGMTSGIKYMGFGEDEAFGPDLVDLDFAPHAMAGDKYSYEGRILALIQNGVHVFPVPITGFSPGAICENSYRHLCASKWCKDNTCQAP